MHEHAPARHSMHCLLIDSDEMAGRLFNPEGENGWQEFRWKRLPECRSGD